MSNPVAVTGATGFIGRHLVESLLDAGFDVRALSRRPDSAALPAPVTVVGGTLEDEASLETLIEGCQAVVHCAGLIKSAKGDDLERVNTAGTSLLAEICGRQPAPPRMVFLSSLAAREPALSGYAASKDRAEQALAAQGAALNWIALRPPAVYGPGDRETLQLFRFMKRGFLPVPGVEKARVSLIYVTDLCDAIVALLSAKVESGSRLEIRDARADGYGWSEVAQAGERFLGKRITCVSVPRTVMRLVAGIDSRLARFAGRTATVTPEKVNELYHDDWVCRDNPVTELTGWRPKVDIDEGMRLTLGWYLGNGWL